VLNFFRINEPFRLVGAFLLLLIFRLPYWIEGPDLLLPELQWMLVGERMSDGYAMYFEIWDYTSPLSAAVYWFVDELFGRSTAVYHILVMTIAFFQVVLFNVIAYRNKFFPENGYIPALIYTVLISFSIDFLTLSPMLMGTTFVLLALNNVISQIEFRAKRDEKLLNIGFYLGIAALFHFPLIVLGPIMVAVLLLFSATITRRFFLIIYGWIGGVFALEKQYDEKYVFVPLNFARDLLDYGNKRTSLEVKTTEEFTEEEVQERLKTLLGSEFIIKNSKEQHALILRTVKIEKLFVYLIFTFIHPIF